MSVIVFLDTGQPVELETETDPKEIIAERLFGDHERHENNEEPSCQDIHVEVKEHTKRQPHDNEIVVVTDLGKIIQATLRPAEIVKRLSALEDEQKYYLYRNHIVPSDDYSYPYRFCGGNNRSFQRSWLDEYSWLVYSIHLDGAYCLPCALFAEDRLRLGLGVLVNRPFFDWHKKSEKLSKHSAKPFHNKSVEEAKSFVDRFEMPEKTLPCTLDARKAANIEKNRHIVKCIAESVLFCGRQCIGLRGDGEIDGNGNPGNFRALLNVIAEHDDALKDHLSKPVLKTCRFVYCCLQGGPKTRPMFVINCT